MHYKSLFCICIWICIKEDIPLQYSALSANTFHVAGWNSQSSTQLMSVWLIEELVTMLFTVI